MEVDDELLATPSRMCLPPKALLLAPASLRSERCSAPGAGALSDRLSILPWWLPSLIHRAILYQCAICSCGAILVPSEDCAFQRSIPKRLKIKKTLSDRI